MSNDNDSDINRFSLIHLYISEQIIFSFIHKAEGRNNQRLEWGVQNLQETIKDWFHKIWNFSYEMIIIQYNTSRWISIFLWRYRSSCWIELQKRDSWIHWTRSAPPFSDDRPVISSRIRTPSWNIMFPHSWPMQSARKGKEMRTALSIYEGEGEESQPIEHEVWGNVT